MTQKPFIVGSVSEAALSDIAKACKEFDMPNIALVMFSEFM